MCRRGGGTAKKYDSEREGFEKILPQSSSGSNFEREGQQWLDEIVVIYITLAMLCCRPKCSKSPKKPELKKNL